MLAFSPTSDCVMQKDKAKILATKRAWAVFTFKRALESAGQSLSRFQINFSQKADKAGDSTDE
jgi:hypothetical protein